MGRISAAFRGDRGGDCDDVVHAPARPHQDEDAKSSSPVFGADGAVDRNTSAKMGGIVRIARQIYADEKSLLSFYRGLSPNMVGNAASWGFYFMWYVSQNGQETMS
jgi:hypothetical protein